MTQTPPGPPPPLSRLPLLELGFVNCPAIPYWADLAGDPDLDHVSATLASLQKRGAEGMPAYVGLSTKYTIDVGEHYEQFYFKVPWAAESVATSYATVRDNSQVLHHWLLFSTNEQQQEGYHFTSPLPTLIGTDPVLLAGWAVGGPNLVAPKDVGFELPIHTCDPT